MLDNQENYTPEQRAAMAEAVLTSPAFMWAWEAMRQSIHFDWENTAVTPELREELYYSMKVLNKTKQYLELLVREQKIDAALNNFNNDI